MKLFDCTLFTDEKLMFELRLNTLNKYVDKFIVSEANFTHSGKPKKLNFDINDYPKFKNKITYIKIDKLPHFNKADLLSAALTIPSGVAELVLKQEQGWSYLKATVN